MSNYFTRQAKKVGRAGLGIVTGGLAGNQDFGLLDNVARAPRQLGNLWEDASGVTAAKGAAEAERAGLANAQAIQEKMFQQALDTQKPWLEAGSRGLSQLEAGINSGSFDTKPMQYESPQYQGPAAFQDLKFDFEADPGYQFRLSEGNKSVQAGAAARGGLFSGKTGTDLQDYSQGLASQEYANAYGRYQDQRNYNRGKYESDRSFGRGIFESERSFGYGQAMDQYNMNRAGNTDRYNRLASLAGVGQTTANSIGNQQIEQGGNLANIAMQQGNIGAQRSQAGYQGGVNLVNTGLQLGALAVKAFGGT